MVRVKSLIARFNGGRVGGAYTKVEVNEAAQAEAERQADVVDQAEAEAYFEPPEVLSDLSVLIVHDPVDETMAEQLVDAVPPRLSVPVRTASTVDEAKEEAKDAEVALLLVSKELEDNWELIEAVANVLPNSIVPVLVDETKDTPADWKGALAWYIPGDKYINFCKPTKDAADEVISEALQAKDRAAGAPRHRSFHAFLSHEWGKDKRVHKMAIELALRLRDYGIDVWLDAEQVSGSIHGSMAEGIDSSTVFLVLASKGYMKKINTGDRSDNCLKEFEYASSKRSNQTVVAALEPDMVRPATGWTGRFKLALARQAPVDLSECSNCNFSDKAIERLADAIKMRIETPEASSDLTPLMCDIYPRLNPCSSEAWAKGKAEKFTLGTRSWIIDELCDWYDKKQSAVFILVGDGGVGKSVIMAELCHRGGALKTDEDIEKSQADERTESRRKSSLVRNLWRRSKKERQPISVAAYHFFRHDDGTAASPAEAILSIAWQLCQTVPFFPEALEQVNLEGLREKTLTDLFNTILVNPATKLGSDQMRQVVVLDALDECSKSDDVLRKVIRTWKDAMPAWLSLVVSTRPEGEIQRGITNNSLDSTVLELKDEENFRDIEKHIEHLLRDKRDIVEQKDVASCAKILTERSEGLFLWASFLPETLNRMHEERRDGLLTLQDISHEDAIPNGLGGMFHEYFKRLWDKMGGDEAYQSLLTPIVAAREPLSVEQLTVVLGKTKKKTKKIIGDARNLLYQGGDGRVALIHKRMADWLLNDDLSGDLGVDIEDGHFALAKYCSSSRNDVFSLRHAVFHLVKGGERAEAFELLNDFAWVKSAISVGDDEAQRRATIGNLIRDCVELDIYFASESDTPRFLSKAVHALSYDPNELASQVLARLGHDSNNPLALGLQTPDQPWLEPTRVTLAHPRDPLLHVLKGHSGTVMSVAIQGDTIVSGSEDNTVRIWNATSGEEQHVLKGHSGWVYSVAIQGDTIVSGSDDKTVRIWNATSGEEQHVLKGHSGWVTSVAIQGDTIVSSDTIVSGSEDNTVRIWNATSGEEQHVLKGHFGPVRSVAIQGDTIVSGSEDNTVRIWNATSGEEQHVLKGHFGPVRSVAIQGDTIVSGSWDNTVRIWNATSGEEQHVLEGHSGPVRSVAIQGDTIVSGSEDNTVRIWNATSDEEQHVLKGHSGWVNSVAIQGDTIVSGSGDKTVRIWNATSGEEQHVLKGHFAWVRSVAIQGDTIVSQSLKETLYWNARTGEAINADEAEKSTTSGTNTLVNVENGTYVKLSEGIGYTTDHPIFRTTRQGSVYVIGDVSGMVHILHVQGIDLET